VTLHARTLLIPAFLLAISAALFAQHSPSEQSDPLQRSRPKPNKAGQKENSYKKWLDEVSPIITPEEMGAFRRLANDSERQSFIEHFWFQRDPTPDTAENEYKEEFYRRRTYADERFSAGKPGSKTDRGMVYIIHGAPDSIDAHPAGGPYLRTAEEGGGQTETFPFEIWRYRNLDGIGQEVEIEFVDSCGCGDYHMTLDRGEKDVFLHVPGAGPTDLEAMQRATKDQRFRGGPESLGPSLFGSNREGKEFDRIQQMALVTAPPPLKSGGRESVTSRMRLNLLPFDAEVDFVKSGPDSVLVPITLSVPNDALTFVGTEAMRHANLSLSGQVTTITGKRVQSFEDGLRLDVPAELLSTSNTRRALYSKIVPLQSGRYRLDIEVKDANGTKTGWISRVIEVPDFGGDTIASSSLIVADLVEPVPANDIGTGNFVIGIRRVRPRVASSGDPAVFRSTETVTLWMEGYNLNSGNSQIEAAPTAEYRVRRLDTATPALVITQPLTVRDHQAVIERRFAPGELAKGDYEVTVTVHDSGSFQSVARNAKFSIR